MKPRATPVILNFLVLVGREEAALKFTSRVFGYLGKSGKGESIGRIFRTVSPGSAVFNDLLDHGCSPAQLAALQVLEVSESPRQHVPVPL
jgi:hypothetical protein